MEPIGVLISQFPLLCCLITSFYSFISLAIASPGQVIMTGTEPEWNGTERVQQKQERQVGLATRD